jgi:hypothetical protein
MVTPSSRDLILVCLIRGGINLVVYYAPTYDLGAKYDGKMGN